jgi:uncharacterized surface protein with fasciclin (FAS1) repeats
VNQEDPFVRRLVLSLTAAALAIGIVAGPVAARTAPPANIVDTAIAVNAQSGEFSTLIAAVLAADPAVLKTLTQQRQLTVFAPTDAAFAKLGLNAGNIDTLPKADLTQILLYHVAPGARYAADVVDSSRIRTLERGFLKVSIMGDSAYVNDSKIIATDIKATNGVIHVIDTVLLP